MPANPLAPPLCKGPSRASLHCPCQCRPLYMHAAHTHATTRARAKVRVSHISWHSYQASLQRHAADSTAEANTHHTFSDTSASTVQRGRSGAQAHTLSQQYSHHVQKQRWAMTAAIAGPCCRAWQHWNGIRVCQHACAACVYQVKSSSLARHVLYRKASSVAAACRQK